MDVDEELVVGPDGWMTTSPTDAGSRRRLPMRRRRLWFECTFPFVFVMIIITSTARRVDVAHFHKKTREIADLRGK